MLPKQLMLLLNLWLVFVLVHIAPQTIIVHNEIIHIFS